jgi:hypothetical protein
MIIEIKVITEYNQCGSESSQKYSFDVKDIKTKKDI